jgi:hypothetical protein
MVTQSLRRERMRKDANRTVKRLGAIPRLTDEDICVTISYREENLDNREYCAKVGAVILLIVIVIAFATLFFHVATR